MEHVKEAGDHVEVSSMRGSSVVSREQDMPLDQVKGVNVSSSDRRGQALVLSNDLIHGPLDHFKGGGDGHLIMVDPIAQDACWAQFFIGPSCSNSY